MLQIRLNRAPSSEAGVGAKTLTVDTVTVACPDHLVLADLPVAKSLGATTAASVVKIVGRRSRRQLGERVHFCVRCDFPIAIYGRLSPCEHAFCLDCARSDSICYLCEERIEKIQTIKMMEGIFVCAAPHCLKSFLKKTEFESHIYESHADLLDPNREKGRNESVNTSDKKYIGSDSTVQVPPGPIFSPSSNSQLKEREDKAHRPQPGDQPSRTVIQPKPTPFPGQILNHPLEFHRDNRTQGFDKPGPENRFPEYPMHPHQPPNFALPMNQNLVMAPSPFNPYFTAPHEILRTNFAPEVGSEQGSLGFSPGPAVGLNFPESYTQPWIIGPSGLPFEPSVTGQRMVDGFTGMSDSQGRATFFQGGFGPNPGAFPSNPPYPPTSNKGMEPMHHVNAMDGNNIASQSLQVPPPPPLSASNMSHLKQGNMYSVLMGHDGQSLGWQQGNRDSFGSGEDK